MLHRVMTLNLPTRSPSSRRAWIEIYIRIKDTSPRIVALLAEGVDRNHVMRFKENALCGRPPRGGRG